MRIAITDDHRIVREGIMFMLSDVPSIEIVGEAATGAELLELLSTVVVDVVLLDVRMPDMSGLEVLAAVRARHPAVRVVMLTMHDDPSLVRRAIEDGAAAYLLKSTGKDELVRALEAVHAGQAYIQPEVTGSLLAQIADSEDPAHLSPRESEVLQLVADGLENKQIARELEISEATVKTYLRNIFETLGARGRAEAVAIALRRGIIS